MATELCAGKLRPLLEYVPALTARATVEGLRTRLGELDLTIGDVAAFVRFGKDQYLRNLVCEGKWYHVLLLCWRSGQRSPIHNHAGSTCGMLVLSGVATETLFEPTPNNLIKAVFSHDMVPGEISSMQDAQIHQISNLQSEGPDLITLHVYSPQLLRMDTYSLTERAVGEYRPMVLEDTMGTGI